MAEASLWPRNQLDSLVLKQFSIEKEKKIIFKNFSSRGSRVNSRLSSKNLISSSLRTEQIFHYCVSTIKNICVAKHERGQPTFIFESTDCYQKFAHFLSFAG